MVTSPKPIVKEKVIISKEVESPAPTEGELPAPIHLPSTKETLPEKILETPEALLEEIGSILAAHDNRESSIDDNHDYWKYLAKYRLLTNP